MDTTTLTVVTIVILAVVAAVVGWTLMRRQRTESLRRQFGPEYEYTLEEIGDQRRAEEELEERQKRMKALEIHPLSTGQRGQFAEAWRVTQARFVDEPVVAVREADRLITEVMEARGYPVGDFEQQAADISVDHPAVVTNYRAAHDIALLNERGEATTEDLRQAMVHYRFLFEDLLHTEESEREVAAMRR